MLHTPFLFFFALALLQSTHITTNEERIAALKGVSAWCVYGCCSHRLCAGDARPKWRLVGTGDIRSLMYGPLSSPYQGICAHNLSPCTSRHVSLEVYKQLNISLHLVHSTGHGHVGHIADPFPVHIPRSLCAPLQCISRCTWGQINTLACIQLTSLPKLCHRMLHFSLRQRLSCTTYIQLVCAKCRWCGPCKSWHSVCQVLTVCLCLCMACCVVCVADVSQNLYAPCTPSFHQQMLPVLPT